MDFEELFDMAVLRDYLKTREYKPYFGEILFPEDKVQDIDLAYIKGAKNLPVSASIHGFDTETEIASREQFEYVKQRLALIKRKIRMGEELLVKLNTPRTAAEFEKAKEIVFNDVDKMVKAVTTRIEAMRMEALSTGKITVNENGAVLTIDYGVPSDNIKTLAGNSVWTDPASDPLNDILTWMNDIIKTSGTKPTRALTSNAVLAALLNNAKVRKDILGNDTKLLTKTTLNTFLQENEYPTIVTYDEQYRVQNQNGTYTSKRFFPENKFVMFGSEPLGETIYGLTPEEIALSGKTDVEISENQKVTVGIYSTIDPVATWTKATATALPTFPLAGEVVIATVK